MRAVVYVRISREEQSIYSIEGQIEACKTFVEQKKYNLGEIYIEDGYSAKNMKRPALQRMLADLAAKKFDIIIIWRLDRLTRDTLDGLGMVINLFRPKGVEFASVTEDIDTSTPDGMMMFTIRLSMAQAEREKIAERSSMGQKMRAKKGLRNTSARPYGYNVEEGLKLTINEDESGYVKQIFQWYLTGWGRIKIARTLNEMNISANRGGSWSEKIIGDILRNITYTGAVHWKAKMALEKDRIIVPGVHDAIIDKDTFRETQQVFVRRREHDMNLSSFDFIYSTVVKCAVCGRSFHGKMKTGGTYQPYRYYRCSGKYRPGSECNASDIVESKITTMLFEKIELIIKPNYDENKPVVKQTIDVEKERKRLEKQISQVKEHRKNFTREWSNGRLKYEEYSELMDEETVKEERCQEELDKLPKIAEVSERTRKDVNEKLKRVLINWDDLDNFERKTAIQGLFKRIVIGKVEKTWEIGAYELNV